MNKMRGNRGGRRGRGRGRGRGGRGRGKKSTKVIESDDDEMPLQSGEEANDENDENQQPSNKSTGDWREQPQPQLDMEADISLLEAPTFTTINRGPPEPMLRLRWDHRVNLMGEKVLNPMIHCCDKCLKPILIYGRMIPCKHVFCLTCAKQEDKICPRCQDNVTRVEQAGLGTVFMCVHGGTRYGNAGCRRTYLSQRDLQAHINHRHAVPSADSTPTQFALNKESASSQSQINKMVAASPSTHPPSISSHAHQSHHGAHIGSSQQRMKHVTQSTDPRVQPVDVSHHRSSRGQSPPPPPPPPYAPMQHRPPMMVTTGYSTTAPPLRTNLITVPIQDVNASISSLDMSTGSYHHHYTQPPPTQYTHSPYGVPPPTQGQYYSTVTYSSAQQQYVSQVVPQGVPQGVPPVAQGIPQGTPQVQGVPQNPQNLGQSVPQGVPPPTGISTALRPPQYQDNQYRAPPPTHTPQWQHPTNNPPPFYR